MDVLIDALPYVDPDPELDPVLKEQVESLIQDEIQMMPPPEEVSDDLDVFPKGTPRYEEFERVTRGEKLDAIDLSRYEVGELQLEDARHLPLKDLQTKVHSLSSQLEYQHLRSANLELMRQFGKRAWDLHVYHMETLVQQAESQLKKIKQDTTEVNRKRRRMQEEAGEALRSLDEEWRQGVWNAIQVEMACAQRVKELHSSSQ